MCCKWKIGKEYLTNELNAQGKLFPFNLDLPDTILVVRTPASPSDIVSEQ